MLTNIKYIILIGQLTGSFESFKELPKNFEKLLRATAKLEQMNWSNIFRVGSIAMTVRVKNGKILFFFIAKL